MTERLTSESAAIIAKSNGLNLTDAAALMQLTTSVPEAEALAQRFAADSMSPDELADAVEAQMGRG